MKSQLSASIVFLYSLVIVGLIPLVRLLAFFHKDLKRQLRGRPNLIDVGKRIAKQRARKQKAVMIFASSAGEYEQAKPIIDRLTQDGDTFVHVVFWSQSGAEYAEKRNENTSWCLAPFDSTHHWGWLFSAVCPNLTLVIRHELWPGFLQTASNWGPVFLVNATEELTVPNGGRVKQLLRRFLGEYFTKIFAVSEKDASQLQKFLPASSVAAIGDTKYDRVLERAAESLEATKKMATTLKDCFGESSFIILGSVYPADWQICFQSAETVAYRNYVPILVPHNVDRNTIEDAIQITRNSGLKPILWSQLTAGERLNANVLIVDHIGQLAELYASASAAYIGGAQHAKIHNVLEPAAYNLPIAHGPNFQNSQEAVRMQEQNHSTIINNHSDFENWTQRVLAPNNKSSTRKFVEEMAGTADQLVTKYLNPYFKQELKTTATKDAELSINPTQ